MTFFLPRDFVRKTKKWHHFDYFLSIKNNCFKFYTFEKIIKAAESAGAKANKLTGAGGGGCLVTYADPKKRDQIIDALKSAGAQILPFKISKEGVRKIS